MRQKLTNKAVDDRLYNRKIKRLDNYIDIDTKINFQCLVQSCGYTWSAKPDNILNNGRGCPKCAGRLPLTNLIVDERLKDRNIKRLTDVVNSRSKIYFQCLILYCNHIWDATPNDVVNSKTGCPSCAGVIKLTNGIIDKRLEGLNIKRIEDCGKNNKQKIMFQCLLQNCNNIWPAAPSNILNSSSGCPICAIPGQNEKLIFNLLKEHNMYFCHNFNIKNINITENKNYRVDFYIPSIKLIIEYNGRQHYGPGTFGSYTYEEATANFEKQKLRDIYIENFCKENNIKLIWIDGRKLQNNKLTRYILDNILKDKLNAT